MISTIMVSIDPGSLSELALDPAAEFAKAHKASITLVAVVTDADSGPTSDIIPEAGDDITTGVAYRRQSSAGPVLDSAGHPGHAGAALQQQLSDIAQNFGPEVGPVDTILASGDAAEAIVDIARRENIDLIIMATHGRTGIARGVLGSVTDAVIRNADVPVLVVRG